MPREKAVQNSMLQCNYAEEMSTPNFSKSCSLIQRGASPALISNARPRIAAKMLLQLLGIRLGGRQ
jgi:hypothetical protein